MRRHLHTLCGLRGIISRVSGVHAIHKRLPLRIRSLRSRMTKLRAHVSGFATRVRTFGRGVDGEGGGVRRSGLLVRGGRGRGGGIEGGHRFSTLDGRVRCRGLRVRLTRGSVGGCATRVAGHASSVRLTRRHLTRHGISLRRGGDRLGRVVTRAHRRRSTLLVHSGRLRTLVRPHLLRTFRHVHHGTHGNLTIMAIRHSTYNNYFGGVPPRHRVSVHVHGGVVIYRCYKHVLISGRVGGRLWSWVAWWIHRRSVGDKVLVFFMCFL